MEAWCRAVAGTADVIGIAYFTGLSKDSLVQGGAGFLAVLLGRLLVPDRTPRTDSPVWGTQLHQNITSASCFPDLLYRLSYGRVSSNGHGKSRASSADPGGGTEDPGPSSWTSTLCWAGNRAPERVQDGLDKLGAPGAPRGTRGLVPHGGATAATTPVPLAGARPHMPPCSCSSQQP